MLDVTDSYTRAVAVTPTDTVPTALFAQPGPAYARRLWVGENFTQVMNTGTSAHEMVAEY